MKNKKILIIDDEKDICLLLSSLLKKEGLETTFANTLSVGKEKIVEFSPQIIFLDLNLPDGAGFSVIPYIKMHLPYSKIVIISAYDGQRERDYANKKFGVEFFIGKPLNKQLILDTITKINL